MTDSVFEALSNPVRRRILALLRKGDMTAGDLADCFPLAKPTMSGHLSKLRAANLVSSHRQGTTIVYSINTSVLEDVLAGFMAGLNLGEAIEEEQNGQ